MSTFTAILILGGYMLPGGHCNEYVLNIESIVLGLKAVIFRFVFVWIRATLPRMRYDSLMVFCWTHMLPIVITLLILLPSLLIAFDIYPYVLSPRTVIHYKYIFVL